MTTHEEFQRRIQELEEEKSIKEQRERRRREEEEEARDAANQLAITTACIAAII